MVALIYTIFNSEVQREVLRSFNRCLAKHYPTWEQPKLLRNLMNNIENEHLNSFNNHGRVPTPEQYRRTQSNLSIQTPRCGNRDRYSFSTLSGEDSIHGPQQELNSLNKKKNHK